MLFNSLNFLIFFPIVVLVYYLFPKRICWIWLLVSSYYFYMSWSPKYAILMAASTIITFFSGIGVDKIEESNVIKEKNRWKKTVVAISFVANIGILVFFKYFDFLLEHLNILLRMTGVPDVIRSFDIILPVGISFYTFQALGYTVDVYRGDIKAEKNIFRYALFVSFFPQLVAGPIERSTSLLRQVNKASESRNFDSEKIVKGLEWMLWGLFLKMVIADRIAVIVNTVFDHYYLYYSFALIVGAVAFAIQVYCDFASYSTIALGAAKVLGFEMTENFNVPYFSSSIREFWRRWHISLSAWFRDYLYIPLGGSRQGRLRKHMNTMIVFLVSGLWHGANRTFLLWGGGVHGFYQIVEEELHPFKQKMNRIFHTKTESFSYRLGQVLITFMLVDVAWIFFRSNTIYDAMHYIIRMFTKPDIWSLFDGTIYTLGLDTPEIHILSVSLLVMFVIDLHQYRTGERIVDFLAKQCLWFHWGVIIAGICAILIYGAYGTAFDPQQFIYFQF